MTKLLLTMLGILATQDGGLPCKSVELEPGDVYIIVRNQSACYRLILNYMTKGQQLLKNRYYLSAC